MELSTNMVARGWDSCLFNLTWSLPIMGGVPFSGHDIHTLGWGDVKMKGQPNWFSNPIPPSKGSNHATGWTNEAHGIIDGCMDALYRWTACFVKVKTLVYVLVKKPLILWSFQTPLKAWDPVHCWKELHYFDHKQTFTLITNGHLTFLRVICISALFFSLLPDILSRRPLVIYMCDFLHRS